MYLWVRHFVSENLDRWPETEPAGTAAGRSAWIQMDSDTWLRSVERTVRAELEHVELSWPDDDTLTLMLGTRGVVLHVTGGVALLAPSFAAGGTIASRLKDRVQHLDPLPYAVTEGTIVHASDAVVAHLRS